MIIKPKAELHHIERSLYPSTIFHFTDEIDSLQNILSSGYFRASYAKEVIIGPKSRRRFGIPMVSFCDIRLSHLYEHTRKYGYFGLGLKKRWAIEKGLNPVSYLNSNCTMFTYFNEQLKGMSRELREIDLYDDHKVAKLRYRNFLNVMRYMKNYEGELERKGEVTKNYRFANENEWRYVPDIKEKIIPAKVIDDVDIEWKIKANEKLWKSDSSRLYFSLKDINYLLVPSESAVAELIDYLGEIIEGDDFTYLISKIFISKHIFSDL
ncbi:abortive infection system antitoxin AbiGi family protein [Dryocola clanedunensis]|uniref:abortive infection system antitoxin AbiGi family protein n=1 Tax=Cedecea sulfonylureivorans TaxID=3051154 RepID=UPI001925D461|nr:abortive infection system antitoxin AbiGi family protein [Cedecea sulfonylureivorans]